VKGKKTQRLLWLSFAKKPRGGRGVHGPREEGSKIPRFVWRKKGEKKRVVEVSPKGEKTDRALKQTWGGGGRV